MWIFCTEAAKCSTQSACNKDFGTVLGFICVSPASLLSVLFSKEYNSILYSNSSIIHYSCVICRKACSNDFAQTEWLRAGDKSCRWWNKSFDNFEWHKLFCDILSPFIINILVHTWFCQYNIYDKSMWSWKRNMQSKTGAWQCETGNTVMLSKNHIVYTEGSKYWIDLGLYRAAALTEQLARILCWIQCRFTFRILWFRVLIGGCLIYKVLTDTKDFVFVDIADMIPNT